MAIRIFPPRQWWRTSPTVEPPRPKLADPLPPGPDLNQTEQEVVHGLHALPTPPEPSDGLLPPLPEEKRLEWATKGRHRLRWQREEDLELVKGWMGQGLSNLEMAARLNAIRPYAITDHQIEYDKRELLNRWKIKPEDLDNQRRSIINSFLHTAREAHAAFERSKQPSKKISKTSGGKKNVEIRVQEERVGDPRFLMTALAAIKEASRFMGLEVAIPQEVAKGETATETSKKALSIERASELLREKYIRDYEAEKESKKESVIEAEEVA